MTPVRVRYQETDQMGVVHHANYISWFETGRTELMRRLGAPYADIETAGIHLAVVSVRCAYRSPARYDETIDVRTRVGSVSAVRVEFEYEVRRGDDLLADGATVLASLDAASGRPRRLPQSILEILERRTP